MQIPKVEWEAVDNYIAEHFSKGPNMAALQSNIEKFVTEQPYLVFLLDAINSWKIDNLSPLFIIATFYKLLSNQVEITGIEGMAAGKGDSDE